MEKKCGNCKYFVELDMPLSRECYGCGDLKHFEPKPITNRQWLESLSDEDFLIAIKNICADYCEYCIYSPNCFGKDCVSGCINWLQAEHKE